MNFSDIAKDFLSSGTIKGAGIALAASLVGFIGREAVQEYKTDTALEWHAKAIADLKQGQEATHVTLEGHTVALTAINGKLDVLNQKLDDDRIAADKVAAASIKRGR